jgi:hypothetical protein
MKQCAIDELHGRTPNPDAFVLAAHSPEYLFSYTFLLEFGELSSFPMEYV